MGKLNIAVIGVGGVGGYFGGKLAKSFAPSEVSENRVYFVARGSHLEAIQGNGLTVNSREFGSINARPSMATDDIDSLPDTDVFIITVKGYDLEDVAKKIKGRVGEKTVILPLLNGADIYERLRNVIKTGIILPACVYISGHIAKPGVVNHTSAPGRVIMGKDSAHPHFMPTGLMNVFDSASIDYEWKEDARPDIWEKYIFIASFGLVTARFNRSIGEVLEDKELKELVTDIMEEIRTIAARQSILLPDGILEAVMEKAAAFPYDTQTSLQRDINKKTNKSELEIFGGTIVELGRKTGIPTPVTEKIYNDLKNYY